MSGGFLKVQIPAECGGGSKNPQAAQQEAVDLSKFLYAIDDQTCCIDKVTTMSNVVKYLNETERKRCWPIQTNQR